MRIKEGLSIHQLKAARTADGKNQNPRHVFHLFNHFENDRKVENLRLKI